MAADQGMEKVPEIDLDTAFDEFEAGMKNYIRGLHHRNPPLSPEETSKKIARALRFWGKTCQATQEKLYALDQQEENGPIKAKEPEIARDKNKSLRQ
ncbi:MAG TPA: hypothetical protein VGV92_06170 [Gammaproteobacteria bacterium]|nr:hypothetical protein [Gammaproteobacteria bacterium]